MLIGLCMAASGLRAQKQDGYFGDSALYALSMQMFDSLRSPAFFDMQRRGLERAVATGNAHTCSVPPRCRAARRWATSRASCVLPTG